MQLSQKNKWLLSIISVIIFGLLAVGSSDSDSSSGGHVSLTEGQKDLIYKLAGDGSIKLEDAKYNRIEIDPSLWANMEYSLKEDFSAALAIYCGNLKGNDLYWCEIYNKYSGKKLAKYSRSWGFKVY